MHTKVLECPDAMSRLRDIQILEDTISEMQQLLSKVAIGSDYDRAILLAMHNSKRRDARSDDGLQRV